MIEIITTRNIFIVRGVSEYMIDSDVFLSIFPFFDIINRGRIYFGEPQKSNIVIIKAHDPYPFILLPCRYDNKRVRVKVKVKVRVRVKVMVRVRFRVRVRSAKVKVLLNTIGFYLQ